ncbi:alpha/beta fold hydrolase [Psychrobacillus sp. NPDC093180]|uniref:alpha/beta fold hydrolase n=1 Tax=Psychrobacillus sp. NPDC093180 TaxID=3364489 RepID=UPI0037F20C80
METINHYNLKTIHLVGCSLGALVAVKFSKLYPERIKTLCISGITAVKPDNWLELHKQDVEMQTGLLNNYEAINYFNQLHASDWRKFIYYGKDAGWYPFEDLEAIAEFNFPVLFILGEEKPHETKGAMIYPKINKNINVAIVPFAGHLVYADQPKIYNNILKAFIEK